MPLRITKPLSRSENIAIIVMITVLVVGFVKLRDGENEEINRRRSVMAVHVMQQYPAFPGMRLQLTSKDDPKESEYVCGPNDAALAIITADDPFDKTHIVPSVQSAVDAEGNAYRVDPFPLGGATLLLLKRGFSRTPKSVSVTLSGSYAGSRQFVTVNLTKIADPTLFVPPPTASEARQALEMASARWNPKSGDVDIRLRSQLPRDESESVTQLGTSYCMPDEVHSPLPPFYGKEMQAVKVRIDRFKNETIPYALIYRNAEVVESNKDSFLLFKQQQVVGSIHGRKITLQNSLPKQSKHRVTKSLRVTQPLVFKWATDSPQKDRKSLRTAEPCYLKVNRLFPAPESIGVDILKVDLPSKNIDGQSVGFSGVFAPAKRDTYVQRRIIPEFRLEVTESRRHLISSKTITLPVAH